MNEAPHRKQLATLFMSMLLITACKGRTLPGRVLAGYNNVAYMGPEMVQALQDCYKFYKDHHGHCPDLTVLVTYEVEGEDKWFWDLCDAELEEPIDDRKEFIENERQACFEYFANLGE